MEAMFNTRLEDIPPDQALLVLVVLAAVGVLYCFLGYRLLKFVLGLTGFVLAGSTAAVVVGFLSYGNLIGMGIGLLFGGICGAMALFFLYKAGVFCLGVLGSTLVAYNVLQGRPEPWILWAVAGLRPCRRTAGPGGGTARRDACHRRYWRHAPDPGRSGAGAGPGAVGVPPEASR